MPDVSDLVDRSAAPATVAVAIDRLRDAWPALPDVLDDPGVAAALVAVFGASRSLTGLVLSEPSAALRVLEHLDERAPVDAADADALVRWKRLEFLRIATRDLLGLDALEGTGAALATMAADVLDGASRLIGTDDRVAVIGMGKLAGRELNYASDVDIMFVGGDDADARALMDVARRCFRVDADLRPEGRSGPLTRSLDSFEAYWDRWAEPWEFQALLKAGPVAGPRGLGDAFAAAAARRVWERPFTAEDLRSLRAMKARAENEVARKGLVDREVKLGRGGIRDVEFSVQLLQLVHGRQDPALRSPNTLVALTELGEAGYVADDDARALADAYRFLRLVEHRLQLVDEQQVHAVPVDPAARDRLARSMGHRDDRDDTAVAKLDKALRSHRAVARSIHERLYFRPLLEAFASSSAPTGAKRRASLTAKAIEARLTAFGFADADRTRLALRELTRGLTRSSRLMQQLLPLLLGWLSEAPDPDLGLLGLRRLSAGADRATRLAGAFRESNEVARRLCVLVGTSRLLTDTLEHNPDLVAALGDPLALAPRSRQELLELGAGVAGWRSERDEQARALQRLKQRDELRVATRDLLGDDDVTDTERQLTALAEAVVEQAVTAFVPRAPFAVIGMGRFGGAELSYASDLDVLFVYDGATGSDFEVAERAAEGLVRFVNGGTPALRIYELDAKLRPEGKQGPLARSLDGYRAYYERWAQTWELQALVRARPVAGDEALGGRFMEMVEPYVWRRPFPSDSAREIRRMKARVERERIPAGDDPQFHLKLGRGSLSDVEWTVQLLQLQHAIRSPGTMAAIAALREHGVLDPADAAVLGAAYRFCERTRNRLYLVRNGPGAALPTAADQLGKLARSLDTTGRDLREEYRRVTRRARQVVERLFYGQVTPTASRPS